MKRILLSAAWLLSIGLYAQVGVNTTDPKSSLEVAYDASLGDKVQAIGLPQVTTDQRDQFKSGDLKKGQMIYNTTKNCVEVYTGSSWDCTGSLQGLNTSNGVSITDISFDGLLIENVSAGGSKIVVTLQNNSFYKVEGVDLRNALSLKNSNSGTVSVSGGGNNVSIPGGGTRKVEYTLTGTPKRGDLSVTFDAVGLKGSKTIVVGLGSAKFQTENKAYAVSLKNENGTPVLQGKIDNSGNKITVQIPYTEGKGSYDPVLVTIPSVQVAAGENGDKKTLKLTIPGGQFTSSSGSLQATVEVEGGQEYLVRLLKPGKNYDIATFNVNIGGSDFAVSLQGIGGVPDRLFGKETNGKLEHQFVYLPVVGPDGKTWLNNNLGANYADISKLTKDKIDITRQATSYYDFDAYGSLYQWGRFEENGYELVNWSSSGGSAPYNKGWRSYSQLKNKKWNPCPEGYRLPTETELSTLRSHIGGSNPNRVAFAKSSLKLPAAGLRIYNDASFADAGSNGRYWSSAPNGGDSAKYLYFNSDGSFMSNYYRSWGFSVRCLKE